MTDTIKWKIFDEWSNSGYLIIKGSKATRFEGYVNSLLSK